MQSPTNVAKVPLSTDKGCKQKRPPLQKLRLKLRILVSPFVLTPFGPFGYVSDESDVPVISDEHATAWEALYVPSKHTREDPNQAPTEIAPSTQVAQEGETPSIPDTPHFDPDRGDPSPTEPAIGVATRIQAKERMTQKPPLLSGLIQCCLDHTGIEACPYHQVDHGVRDPDCDHCKRALGPLYHHKITGNRHLPVFTFDFSGPHPHKVNMTQYLLVSVWSLGHMRLIWAFGVESRQASVVLPSVVF